MRAIELRRSGVAAYQQIVLRTKQALRLGSLLPGDRLPTAKEAAETSAVHSNTTLKAYRDGAGGARRTASGAWDVVLRSPARPLEAERARAAGLDGDDVAALVASALEERYPGASVPAGDSARDESEELR